MPARELGAKAERTRTTIWIDPDLHQVVKLTCEKLGVRQTSLITMATAQYCAQLSPLLGPGMKRKDILKKMKTVFSGIVAKAGEGL